MFTGSTKLPPAKTPQPERLDEVYAALRRGLQSYLQVHQLELDTLGQQIRENKRNGRLGSLYEQDKQVKAIERFMRRLEFHLSKVEELYDGYCIQRRLRDGASKMVAAFNSATGSKEARESLSEANRGFRECTEHMCSLESELESHMGEFHVKMKGLAGFARLCAGDQYEVLMRYGRQRWRLRGRVEVSSKQIWDSEEYIFLPLVTELLSIKSLLKRQGELDNGTVWSNSSESSDDSSSPALAHHAQRLSASNVLQTAVPAPHKSSASTPSLSSNQEEDESEAGEVFSPRDSVHNGHPTSCSRSRVGETGPECTVTDRLSVQPAELLGTSAERSRSCSDVSSTVAESLERTEECPAKDSPEDLTLRTTAGTTEAEGPRQPAHHLKHSDGAPTVPFPTSSSFTQEVETALESFDFLNCSDLEEEEEEEAELQEQADHQEKDERQEDDERRTEDEHQEKEEQEEEDEHQKDDKGAKQAGEEQHGEDQDKSEQDNRDKKEEDKEMFYSGASDEEAGDGLEFLMEAPEGFRNSDEDRVSESQESSAEEEQDLSRVELPEEEEGHGEDPSHDVQEVEAERPPTPSHLATTVF
ncbi:rho family-interacting cell polarization regulator 1 isoform X2 [Phyllopteryx taeniolatus]|uniref:rho family-interacting cell polarization regulator 1 isoform X2 n=1 Tax=Phyllopteryx taeniolatus TaxID=161469 RepID=UPI002AD4E052|nr:rho family-interacting cell polarization regulator 1 isoform X2 [Phyllopteryx taeniolatus]